MTKQPDSAIPRPMNPYRHFIGEIEAALKAMQAAGELPPDARFLRHHGRAAARCCAWRHRHQRRHGAGQGRAQEAARHRRAAARRASKANPDVVDGAVAGPGFINLKISRRLLARAAARLPQGGRRPTAIRRWGEGSQGQCRVRLGQSDRAAACGACARRGGRRCAGQPARQGGLCRHQGVLHQRCRRAGRQARALDLPALQGGAGRCDRRHPRRPLSRRVPEGRGRGDRQARRRALDRQAAVRLAAGDARLRHRHADGRDQGRPRDARRPHRRLFVRARAGRFRRGRSRLPGAQPPGPDLHRAGSSRPRARSPTTGRIASRRCSGRRSSATMSTGR